MLHKLLFIIAWLLISFIPVLLFTQNRTLTGCITDENNEPIKGAFIKIEGTTASVESNTKGRFAISVPYNAVIVVSEIGYKRRVIDVSGIKEITVKLTDFSSNEGYTKDVIYTINGYITSDKDVPLQGATIYVKNSSEVVSSDVNGKFTITVPAETGITVRAKGYKSQKITVSGVAALHVKLRNKFFYSDENSNISTVFYFLLISNRMPAEDGFDK